MTPIAPRYGIVFERHRTLSSTRLINPNILRGYRISTPLFSVTPYDGSFVYGEVLLRTPVELNDCVFGVKK